MGIAMPTNDVTTRGRRQYPNTEAERANVSVEEKCRLPVGACASCADDWSAGERGGDINERIV
jgi:hypothetical protein